jgi:tetratricopeptide (TPR) repeat protein
MSSRLVHFPLVWIVFSALSLTAFAQSGCRPPGAQRVSPLTPEESRVDDLLSQAFEADRQGNWLAAKRLYLAAVARAEDLPDDSAEKWQALRHASNAYMRDNNPEESIAMAKRAVALAKKTLSPQDPELASDVGQLAFTLQLAGRMAEAAPLYDKAVKAAEIAQDMDCAELAGLYGNASGFYMAQKRFAEAEAVLRQAAEAVANVPPPLRPLIVKVRAELAAVLREEGKEAEAEELLASELAPASVNPQAHPDLTGPLDDLNRARQYHTQGRDQEAEFLYRRAISALEKAPPQSAAGPLSSAWDGLGEVCHSLGRDPEAEELLLRALDLREKGAGNQIQTIGVTRELSSPFALQNFYRDEGRLGEMEQIYQRAIQIQGKYLGPNDDALANTFFSAASLYAEENKPEPSLPLYRHALQISEHNMGPLTRGCFLFWRDMPEPCAPWVARTRRTGSLLVPV